ncbi:hypothetical protein ACFPRL_30550 [Pseudoclavibacter helvolus]
MPGSGSPSTAQSHQPRYVGSERRGCSSWTRTFAGDSGMSRSSETSPPSALTWSGYWISAHPCGEPSIQSMDMMKWHGGRRSVVFARFAVPLPVTGSISFHGTTTRRTSTPSGPIAP